jgi:hypothetical protein
MAEKSPNDESGLDDSISGEFPENADSTEKSQKLNESDTGTVPKKIRLHTSSPGPEPFMVQRKIWASVVTFYNNVHGL